MTLTMVGSVAVAGSSIFNMMQAMPVMHLYSVARSEMWGSYNVNTYGIASNIYKYSMKVLGTKELHDKGV